MPDYADQNPYAAPQSSAEPLPVVEESALSEAQRIRNQYLNHEAEVRSVGGLFYLIGGLVFLLGMISVFTPSIRSNPQPNRGGLILIEVFASVLVCAVVGLLGFLGHGIRTLNQRAQWPAAILVGLVTLMSVVLALWLSVAFSMWMLPFAAIPAMISGYILYLLISGKGRMVFSPYYAEVRRQTPQLTYRTPLTAMVLLLIVLGVIAAALLLPALRGGVFRP